MLVGCGKGSVRGKGVTKGWLCEMMGAWLIGAGGKKVNEVDRGEGLDI